MSRSPAMSGKAIATKSLKEKWISKVQLATEKGENAIGGSSTVTRALKLLGLFYKEKAYDETSESTGDTSLETPSRATPEISRRGIFIPTTTQSTDGGLATEMVALIDSRAMICCVNLEFAREMKWPLQKLW